MFCVGSGPAYDGGIEPWQSGVWGSEDASGAMVMMREQPFYTADLFGLKTLDDTGRLNLTVRRTSSPIISLLRSTAHPQPTHTRTHRGGLDLPWMTASMDPPLTARAARGADCPQCAARGLDRERGIDQPDCSAPPYLSSLRVKQEFSESHA